MVVVGAAALPIIMNADNCQSSLERESGQPGCAIGSRIRGARPGDR